MAVLLVGNSTTPPSAHWLQSGLSPLPTLVVAGGGLRSPLLMEVGIGPAYSRALVVIIVNSKGGQDYPVKSGVSQ